MPCERHFSPACRAIICLVFVGSCPAFRAAGPTRADGADSVAVDASGDLSLRTSVGEVRQHAPRIYQDVNGIRREVAGGYTIRSEREVGFELAAYDASRPLVIDPQLVYATYLGGNFIDGDIASLAVDASGSAYVCGSTQSTDFPTEHAFQDVRHANETAFVTKLSPDGSSLVYSTFLGGSLFDLGWGIAVNAAGEAYVTGTTSSDDFPVKNAIQLHRADHSMDAFVTKLSADGSSLLFSTFLGGTGTEQPAGIRLDPDSNAYVFGTTTSTDFPVKLAAQASYSGGVDDGFVAIVDAAGSALLSATYFGGNGDDKIQSLAIDPQMSLGRGIGPPVILYSGPSESDPLIWPTPSLSSESGSDQSSSSPINHSDHPDRSSLPISLRPIIFLTCACPSAGARACA